MCVYGYQFIFYPNYAANLSSGDVSHNMERLHISIKWCRISKDILSIPRIWEGERGQKFPEKVYLEVQVFEFVLGKSG